MELLHLWIEKEMLLENCSLNLSSKFQFEFLFNKENKTLQINGVKNPLYIEGLFGSTIVNISAIVGANGVGKSTLLGFITRLLTDGMYLGEKWVAIFYSHQTKKVYTYHTLYDITTNAQIEKRWKVQVQIRDENIELLEPEHIAIGHGVGGHPNDWSIPILKSTKLIFYFPAFDFRNYPDSVKNNKSYEDVSTNHLLFVDSENDYEKTYDQIEHHRFQNTRRQFELSQSNLAELKELNIPKDIIVLFTKTNKVDVTDLGTYTRGVYEYLRSEGSHNGQKCNTLIEKAERTRKRINVQRAKLEKIKSWFVVNLLDNFFDNLSDYKDLDDKMFKVSLDEIKTDDFITSVRLMFNKQQWIRKDQFDFDSFINFVFDLIDKDALLTYELPDNESYFNIDTSKALDMYQWHSRYLQIFQGIRRRKGFLELNWRDLSTGEKAFLDLYSRIYYAYRRITDKFLTIPAFDDTEDDREEKPVGNLNFIYLLLDEAELGFHPLWQKQFINSIVTFINRLTTTKVQVILTSHSPFVLSDLPRENVIFLSKNNERVKVSGLNSKSQTFAANIHELFSDSFFMSNGLIGEFAMSFIEKLIKELSDVQGKDVPKELLDDLKIRVEMIGEPIIQSRLFEMLSNISVLETTEDRITRLETELAEARTRKPK